MILDPDKLEGMNSRKDDLKISQGISGPGQEATKRVPSLKELLIEMIKRDASDLHLTVNAPPMLRINGKLEKTPYAKLTPDQVMKMAYSIMTEQQRKEFEKNWEVDLSFSVRDVDARFRANVFHQRGAVAVAIRQIPKKIKSFKDLGLPPVIKEFCDRPNGLVLVTGPTGSGKSTTLAAMIDYINESRKEHIITIEDPIEFVHEHKNCIVNQREVKADTHSFANALKYALRQDPDVILVGEMRDLETIEAALTLAETGHLTFATLHTNSAAQTIHRIIDVFPAHQQATIRAQLAFVLQGVITQALIPKMDGTGRVLAMEIMNVTPAIRALIRDDKIHQIPSMIEAGQRYGMITMNQSLAKLVKRGLISVDMALARSPNPEELSQLLNKGII